MEELEHSEEEIELGHAPESVSESHGLSGPKEVVKKPKVVEEKHEEEHSTAESHDLQPSIPKVRHVKDLP